MIASRSVSTKAVVVFVVLGLVCGAAALAQSVEDQGRAILEKNQKAVVTVQLVIKMSMGAMGSDAEESKQESTGFIIDPTGLIVMPLSVTDPGGMMESMMSAMGADGDQFKMQTSLGEIKALLDDGTELPAQVVLRDKDLDLAFLRTREKPAKPLPFIDLGQSGEARVLDQVVALNRLGKVANRASSVSLERIEAIVKKPRVLYLPGNDPTQSGLGSPIFTLDGKTLGMIVMRTIKDEGGGMMDLMGGGMMKGMASVILPAGDILEAAKQAPAEVTKEAPVEAPKEAPKEAPQQEPVIIPNQSAPSAAPGV